MMALDLLIVATFILTIIGTIGQLLEVFLSWHTLKEIGDMDGDTDDWWEKKPKVEPIIPKQPTRLSDIHMGDDAEYWK